MSKKPRQYSSSSESDLDDDELQKADPGRGKLEMLDSSSDRPTTSNTLPLATDLSSNLLDDSTETESSKVKAKRSLNKMNKPKKKKKRPGHPSDEDGTELEAMDGEYNRRVEASEPNDSTLTDSDSDQDHETAAPIHPTPARHPSKLAAIFRRESFRKMGELFRGERHADEDRREDGGDPKENTSKKKTTKKRSKLHKMKDLFHRPDDSIAEPLQNIDESDELERGDQLESTAFNEPTSTSSQSRPPNSYLPPTRPTTLTARPISPQWYFKVDERETWMKEKCATESRAKVCMTVALPVILVVGIFLGILLTAMSALGVAFKVLGPTISGLSGFTLAYKLYMSLVWSEQPCVGKVARKIKKLNGRVQDWERHGMKNNGSPGRVQPKQRTDIEMGVVTQQQAVPLLPPEPEVPYYSSLLPSEPEGPYYSREPGGRPPRSHDSSDSSDDKRNSSSFDGTYSKRVFGSKEPSFVGDTSA